MTCHVHSMRSHSARWPPRGLPGPLAHLDDARAVQTLTLTVTFQEAPPAIGRSPDQRCLGVWRLPPVCGGLYEEDGELWDTEGRLLARPRLLGRYLAAPDAGSHPAPAGWERSRVAI